MQEQSWKVTLPGLLCKREGQWWWEVKLPGEDQARIRPLNVPAGYDPEIARKAAVTMWEQAVVRDGAKQIILDWAAKVERFKSQFLDKLRHLTELVESATAKAQAEASARAEMEVRLNAVILAAGFGSQAPAQQTTVPTPEALDSPVNPQADVPHPPEIEAHPAPSELGLCECCGATGIPTADLERIDSGQFLCPDCLHTLRVAALQAELDALAASLS